MISLLEQRLSHWIPSPSPLTKAMEYSFFSGGKRLRPLFTLHVVETFAPNEFPLAVDAALAIECIHTYSLIHDDLPCMDDDDMRRGKPSLHKAVGENIALLAGDALLTLAFEIMGSMPSAIMTQKLAKLAGYDGMIKGQLIDISLSKEALSKEKVFHLYELKTANLFMAAIEMGALISKLDPKTTTTLTSFGKLFGISFQIADDIEDFTTGKNEIVAQIFGIETLISWYEETKLEAKNILKTLPQPIPFFDEVFDLLEKKVTLA